MMGSMVRPQLTLNRISLAFVCFGSAVGIVSLIFATVSPAVDRAPSFRAIYVTLYAPLWAGLIERGAGVLLGRPIAGFFGCAIVALLGALALIVASLWTF